MTKYYWLIIALFLSSSCASTKKQHTAKEPFESKLTISQGVNTFNITSKDTVINLNKSTFTFTFNLQQQDDLYAAKIAITENPEDVQYFQEGLIGPANPYFSPGTGNAGYKNAPYSSIFLRDNGHHYIFYNSPNERRATLVKQLTAKRFRVKWDIHSITHYGEKHLMEDVSYDTVYFMFFNDLNLNGSIDDGEYHRIQVNFD